MMIRRIEQIKSTLLGRLASADRSLTSEDWLAGLVEALYEGATSGHYRDFPLPVAGAEQHIRAEHGSQAAEDFNRLLMIELIRRWSVGGHSNQYSESIRRIYERETARILDEIEDARSSLHLLDNDQFLKDAQCYTGRMIPCGAQVVDLVAGVPRRVLTTDHRRRIVPNLAFFARAGGFDSYCEIHTHTPTLFEFNADGWDDCYHRVADLLEHLPRIRGMVGSSWFYDPKLDKVSPRLAYLRDRPIDGGARFFRVGSSEASRRDALATSETRRRLYREGKYVPTHYSLVWLRRDMLVWSRRKRTSLRRPTEG